MLNSAYSLHAIVAFRFDTNHVTPSTYINIYQHTLTYKYTISIQYLYIYIQIQTVLPYTFFRIMHDILLFSA